MSLIQEFSPLFDVNCPCHLTFHHLIIMKNMFSQPSIRLQSLWHCGFSISLHQKFTAWSFCYQWNTKRENQKKRYFILNHLIPNLLTFHYRYVSSSSFFSTINHDVAYQPNKQIPPRHDLRLKTTKKALQKTACLEVSLWAESTANSTLKNTTRISTVSSLSSQILFFAVSPWLPRWIRVKSLHVCELELNFDIY